MAERTLSWTKKIKKGLGFIAAALPQDVGRAPKNWDVQPRELGAATPRTQSNWLRREGKATSTVYPKRIDKDKFYAGFRPQTTAQVPVRMSGYRGTMTLPKSGFEMKPSTFMNVLTGLHPHSGKEEWKSWLGARAENVSRQRR